MPEKESDDGADAEDVHDVLQRVGGDFDLYIKEMFSPSRKGINFSRKMFLKIFSARRPVQCVGATIRTPSS